MPCMGGGTRKAKCRKHCRKAPSTSIPTRSILAAPADRKACEIVLTETALQMLGEGISRSSARRQSICVYRRETVAFICKCVC